MGRVWLDVAAGARTNIRCQKVKIPVPRRNDNAHLLFTDVKGPGLTTLVIVDGPLDDNGTLVILSGPLDDNGTSSTAI